MRRMWLLRHRLSRASCGSVAARWPCVCGSALPCARAHEHGFCTPERCKRVDAASSAYPLVAWRVIFQVALSANRLGVVALLQTLDRLEKGAVRPGGISTATLRRVEDRLVDNSAKVEDRLKRLGAGATEGARTVTGMR